MEYSIISGMEKKQIVVWIIFWIIRTQDFSGNIYEAENERTYSLNTLPQEYSTSGVGDFSNLCNFCYS